MFLLLYVTGLVVRFSLLSIFILSFLLPDAPHDRSPFPRFSNSFLPYFAIFFSIIFKDMFFHFISFSNTLIGWCARPCLYEGTLSWYGGLPSQPS